jgi:iron complex transport system ATP-binding protein
MSSNSVELRDVLVVYDHQRVLGPLSLDIEPGQRWIVLGPNGSGKTSLVRILSLYRFPSTGTVKVLGERWGRTDVRELRKRIGLASSALRDQFRADISGVEIVITARHAALETWWHSYEPEDEIEARECLRRVGAEHLGDREFATMSSGEQQRVQLARTLMGDPGLLIFDEPTAGLDLGGREELVQTLSSLADDPTTPPIVLITHHTDEIPPNFTHALMLRKGGVLAAGPLGDVLTADNLTKCFGLELRLEQRDGRWLSWAALAERTHA